MFIHRQICIVFAVIIAELWKCTVIAGSSTPLPIDQPDDEQLELQPIAGTGIFRSNVSKDISGSSWPDDRRDRHVIRCVRPAKCEKLQYTSCFDARIPYKFTSTALSGEENASQEKNYYLLQQLQYALRNVPKCWAVIQPFLCSVYLPKCTRSNGQEYVYLPSFEMCQVTYAPCRILYDTDFFPQILRCNEQHLPCKNCSNDVREMKFDVTGQCMAPLVPTESTMNFYPSIEGCGRKCKDPLYTDEEHESVHTFIFWGASVCIVCNLFVILTFLIHDWKHSKHPAWNLFYISICFLWNWIGWMLQFIPGHRENICRQDGTLRYSEPSAGENLSCIIPFILIYYFLIAANVWFAIFTYAWYLQTKDRGSIRDRIDKESFYFHFIAWALPFILTVTIMVLSEVDGNSITGICFVGYKNRAIRTGLVLVPVAILSFCVSVFFVFKGSLNLNYIKRSTCNSAEAKKLSSHISGMGIRTMLVVFFILVFFIFETYEVRNAEIWAKSLNDMIICKIKEKYSGYMSPCSLQNRPSAAVLQLRLLCLFCVNLVISSWCWTWPALKTWKRFIRKKIGYELSEDVLKPKHRIIADAYAKRMDDVISVSIQNSHTDPACANFDMNNLNMANSDPMGATFTNYLPNMVHRRNALTRTDLNSAIGAPYTSSCADNNSEINVSVQHFSVEESRRNSIDSQVSQVSVKMSHTNIKATLESHSQKHKSVNMKAKKKQRNYMYAKRTNRRASSSSVESQRITNHMKSVRYKYPGSRIEVRANTTDRKIERRSACTTADINDIHKLRNEMMRIENSSDDDQSMDESQPMHQPSNMLIPMTGNQVARRDDGFDKEASIEHIIKHFIQNSNGKQLENWLRNSYEMSCDRNGTGNSGGKSTRRKDARHFNKTYLQQNMADHLSSKLNNGNDTSVSSSVDLDIIPHLDGTRSSFSDQSMNRMKTQSQNSKGSCDVGIQANEYDIASHVRQISRDDCDKDHLSEKLQMHLPDDNYTETHQLLQERRRKRDAPQIVRKDVVSGKHLTESDKMEKLKKLLLPSN